MNRISISELKINPSAAISKAADYPLAVENRNNIQAYLIGKTLYEKLVSYIEDYIDRQAVEKTDFTKGRNFEDVAKDLGL
jgi:hypothetical protein